MGSLEEKLARLERENPMPRDVVAITWGEFKRQVEAHGVKDEGELWYIDTSFNESVECSKDEEMGWAIS